ncbi:hypothetical protein O181_095306 [Austropuccinia psidii MF-1]|uniref:Uncharacterized protein n=1 Tax=Austropuccinia psidii MF-1 TaxID=1389203 RepID=A0A9Q3PD67_9BASI|nr:hypothetical protein [Austropuccinia psidii MF-1]
MIQSARWFQDPNTINKEHGSAALYLINKEVSFKIKFSVLFIKNKFFGRSHYFRKATQCYKFWKIGHTAPWCKNQALCGKCGNTHDTTIFTTIKVTLEQLPCIMCVTSNKTTSKHHEKKAIPVRRGRKSNTGPT